MKQIKEVLKLKYLMDFSFRRIGKSRLNETFGGLKTSLNLGTI